MTDELYRQVRKLIRGEEDEQPPRLARILIVSVICIAVIAALAA